jgi:lysophospholipase L1-like esterase
MKSSYKNLLLVALSITLSLFLAEVGTRVITPMFQKEGPVSPSLDKPTFNVPIYRPDSQLFWRTKPLARFKGMDINSKGFRGKEFSTKKSSGMYRIIALGDSSTLGVGVPNSETYCAILESLLNQPKNSSRRYEVINAGVAGYSSLQGFRYLKSDIINYQPDLITIYFGLNDYLYARGQNDQDRPQLAPWVIRIDLIMSYSQFYRLLTGMVSNLINPGKKYPPDRRVDFPDFKNNLVQMITVAREVGAEVILLNVPLRPAIPLVVNPVPLRKEGKDGPRLEWLRPAYIGKTNYFIKTEFEGPTSELEEIVDKYPQWAMAHYLLAKRYEKIGEIGKARTEYQKAREMDFDRDVVASYNRAIEEVASALRVPLVDLVGGFATKRGEDLFLDERHPSALGHKFIAEGIFSTLKSNKLSD